MLRESWVFLLIGTIDLTKFAMLLMGRFWTYRREAAIRGNKAFII
jgi:hypothetical protein